MPQACRINSCRLAKPGRETRRTVDILFAGKKKAV
jgi:hypothetical protein